MAKTIIVFLLLELSAQISQNNIVTGKLIFPETDRCKKGSIHCTNCKHSKARNPCSEFSRQGHADLPAFDLYDSMISNRVYQITQKYLRGGGGEEDSDDDEDDSDATWIYRSAVEKDPTDVEAMAGLGRALVDGRGDPGG